eukprot:2000716-Prymnesium_polylepis.1
MVPRAVAALMVNAPSERVHDRAPAVDITAGPRATRTSDERSMSKFALAAVCVEDAAEEGGGQGSSSPGEGSSAAAFIPTPAALSAFFGQKFRWYCNTFRSLRKRFRSKKVVDGET